MQSLQAMRVRSFCIYGTMHVDYKKDDTWSFIEILRDPTRCNLTMHLKIDLYVFYSLTIFKAIMGKGNENNYVACGTAQLLWERWYNE